MLKIATPEMTQAVPVTWRWSSNGVKKNRCRNTLRGEYGGRVLLESTLSPEFSVQEECHMVQRDELLIV